MRETKERNNGLSITMNEMGGNYTIPVKVKNKHHTGVIDCGSNVSGVSHKWFLNYLRYNKYKGPPKTA